VETLKVAVAELSQQLKETGAGCGKAEDDAMVALQSALATLKGRFQKLTRENTDLVKNYEHIVQTSHQMETRDAEQKEEIARLKQRLMIGQEAYKELYLDRQKLQSELDRIIRGAPTLRRSIDGRDTKTSEQGVSSEPELLQHMAEIRHELEKRTEKATKYKHLYWEQKRKVEAVSYQLNQALKMPSHEMSIHRETLNHFDPLARSDSSPNLALTPPLKPLPAPMQPEILASAKVASVKATLGAAGGGVDIVVVRMPGGGETVFDMNADVDPASTADDDKFVDAPGEPLTEDEDCLTLIDGCPEEIFLAPAPVGYVCPMCSKVFPFEWYNFFEEHVNSHF
jgi:hypothetical protein